DRARVPSRACAAVAGDAHERDARRRLRAPCRMRPADRSQAHFFPVFAEPPPPLICLDPGHGTPPAIGRQTEPIGPGSRVRKIKDGGGAPGEAPVALAIGLKMRTLLRHDGFRVAMTRTGPTTT